MASKQTDEHVAHHEAGHFVAAYLQGTHERTTERELAEFRRRREPLP
jgi:hypothetical protein